MGKRIFGLNRRELIAGLGAAVLGPAPLLAAAPGRQSLMWQAKPEIIALRPGEPATSIWSLQTATPNPPLRFRRGVGRA